MKGHLDEGAQPPPDLEVHVVGTGDVAVLSYTPRGQSTLTDAELRVAIGVARGRSNAEIASSLRVSDRTVANHVAAVLRKLGAPSRSAVAARFGIDDML
jgi:DNA-binding NarL/FixJ family response regulator